MEKNQSIDPYKILNVPKNFSLEQLREAYKKIALQVHPDKGGTEYMFKLVTISYKTLAKEYERRVGNKQYNELKSEFSKNQTQQNTRMSNLNIDSAAAKGFNIERFNRVFEENKTQSVTDIGYGDFLKDSKEIETKNMFQGKKFSNTAFNKIFEKKVAASTDENNKFVVKYKEPEPLQTCKKISFVELGQDNIDDFSGDNTSRKNLNYMDVKLAYTTSRIVDPRTVDKRKEYKSVDDLKNDRGNISYAMDSEDAAYYEKKKLEEELKEKRRLERVHASDIKSAEQFERIHQLLLGRRPS